MSWFAAPKAPSRRVAIYWTKADGTDMRADGFEGGLRHGHYILHHAELVLGVHEREADAGTIEIPASRVDFRQILGGSE